MNLMFRKPSFVMISFGLLSIGIYAWLLYLNMEHYMGALDFGWMWPLCIMPIWLVGMSYYKPDERSRIKKSIRIIAFTLPIAAVVLFQLYKPAYDFQRALNKIENAVELENVQLQGNYYSMGFTPKPHWFVRAGYVLDAKQGDNSITIFINPVTGDYGIIER